MPRRAFVLSVVVVALSAGVATAQGPAVGRLEPPGDLFGYSPLVPSIDPFPSRTSGYALSIFSPMGGKRLYPPPVVVHRPVVIITLSGQPADLAPTPEPVVVVPGAAGPVVWPAPARGLRRFGR